MQLAYGDDSVDVRIVCRWAKRCKDGQAGSLICVTKSWATFGSNQLVSQETD